jgi:hypothetical protein
MKVGEAPRGENMHDPFCLPGPVAAHSGCLACGWHWESPLNRLARPIPEGRLRAKTKPYTLTDQDQARAQDLF